MWTSPMLLVTDVVNGIIKKKSSYLKWDKYEDFVVNMVNHNMYDQHVIYDPDRTEKSDSFLIKLDFGNYCLVWLGTFPLNFLH